MLYLYLFGHLSVASGDGATATAEVELAGRPGSLLAYLALARGRFFARSELLAALWPEQSEGATIRSLNTVLWRLRKALARPRSSCATGAVRSACRTTRSCSWTSTSSRAW